MQNSTTIRPAYDKIGVGEGNIKKNQFEVFIPRITFKRVGQQIKDYLGERQKDFAFVIQMFELECIGLYELDAFLILEELAILIQEVENQKVLDTLRKIYHALKHQVYRQGIAVVCPIN